LTETKALVREDSQKIISAITEGAADKLSVQERAEYLLQLCNSLGLNPLSAPFEWTKLNGKLVPYAKKNCTDQLRKIHHINCTVVERKINKELGLISVTVRVSTPDGREDEDIGCVPLPGKGGEAMSNAMMKALTKAKRRATLSLAGLSLASEDEIESVGRAVRARIVQSDFPVPVAAEELKLIEEVKEKEVN
jgi:hypothetical protein